jgi:predicted nucleic acid-binding protein
MKLLLDTNIVVDVLSRRSGYLDSLKVLRCCEAKKADGFVSAVTVTDVMYILRKHMKPEDMRGALLTFVSIVDIADVAKSDIREAFSCGMRDFEDAVQAMCAKRIRADRIVTRNVKDFEGSPVRAVLPADVLALMK